MNTSAPAKSALRTLRIVAGVLLVIPVIVVVVMWFLLGDSLTQPTPWLYVIGVLVIGAVGHLILRAVGYHAEALNRGVSKKDAMAQSKLSYQAALSRRIMTAELPMIVSLTLAFSVPGGFYLVLFGSAATLNLLVLHVWPSERSIERVRVSLEREGAKSYLREALG